jgi:hypothetical protein
MSGRWSKLISAPLRKALIAVLACVDVGCMELSSNAIDSITRIIPDRFMDPASLGLDLDEHE